jgi:hypothetical protein
MIHDVVVEAHSDVPGEGFVVAATVNADWTPAQFQATKCENLKAPSHGSEEFPPWQAACRWHTSTRPQKTHCVRWNLRD